MDAREQILQRLVANIEDLTKFYRQMLELVQKERDLLVGARIDELMASNELKENLIMKIRLADELRLKIAAEAALAVGANSKQPRLLDIASKCANAPIALQLKSLHSGLEILVKRISDANKDNENYTKSALKTLNGAMKDIKETLSGKKTYEKKGGYKLGPETTGNFVSKEA